MSPREKKIRVLVTGASGYIALHCVKQLLLKDYIVRGTVRSLRNDAKVQPIRDLVPEQKDRLELVEADLLDEACWNTAVEGCRFVLHVASPFVAGEVKDEQELIKPAVEGTLNVLRACAATEGAVKRVVLTSSVAAIFAGHKLEADTVRTFTEEDWTDPDGPDVTAYLKSKYLAEKAAWDFVGGLKEEEKFELSVMNPGLVVGPLLHTTEGASAEIVKKMMTGGMPFLPKVMMPVIDVRDVAAAHVKGMEMEKAAGQRFILALRPPPTFKDISNALEKEFKSQGYGISSGYDICSVNTPTPLLKVAAIFDATARSMVPRSGIKFDMDNSKMLNVLKIDPIPMSKSLADMGHSLIEKGLVKKAKKYRGPNSEKA